jgi:uncharacterized membrane protein YgcG
MAEPLRSDRPPSPASSEVTLGQRLTSALVDVIFFAVVWSLARERVIEGQAVVGLLSMYAGARFGIAHGKQQTVIALSRQRDDHWGGGGGGGGISSSSTPAVRPIEPHDSRVDRPFDPRHRRLALAVATSSPLLALLVRMFGGAR